MKLLGKEIGDGRPCFVIAEAGINHNGSIAAALDMVKAARDCGADAVKFQKRDLKTLYRPEVLADPALESQGLGVYVPLLRECELSEDDHLKIQRACDVAGIKYLCSPWDLPSLEFLDNCGVEAFKLPSACFSDVYLIEAARKTGKPCVLSTGMHDDVEVQMLALSYANVFGPDMLAFTHCVSSYPTANKDVNLRYMDVLRRKTGRPVGYSGHERGIPITVAAVALGACIVERHFTLDRTLKGPDHAASLEVHGLETLVRHVRAVEEAMGSSKTPNRGEVMARETIGKALTWARTLEAGAVVAEGDFMATSPGYGLPVHEASNYVGSKVVCGVVAGELVERMDFVEVRP
jgi:sialic acid synthase SpsE